MKIRSHVSSNYSRDNGETKFVPRALFNPEPSSEILEMQSAPSKKRFRGKALPWELIRGNPTSASLEEVLKNTAASNLSKCKLLSATESLFKCDPLRPRLSMAKQEYVHSLVITLQYLANIKPTTAVVKVAITEKIRLRQIAS